MIAVTDDEVRRFILKAVRNAAGLAEDNYRRATIAQADRDADERQCEIAKRAVARIEREMQ